MDVSALPCACSLTPLLCGAIASTAIVYGKNRSDQQGRDSGRGIRKARTIALPKRHKLD